MKPLVEPCLACGQVENGVFCVHSLEIVLEAEEAIERGSVTNDKKFELSDMDQAIFVVQTWEGSS
jgi:hypothetical protein